MQAPAPKQPFRFLALPKEMQSEVLDYLDLATCKAISRCSKAARKATVRLSGNQESRISASVRSFQGCIGLCACLHAGMAAESSRFPQKLAIMCDHSTSPSYLFAQRITLQSLPGQVQLLNSVP